MKWASRLNFSFVLLALATILNACSSGAAKEQTVTARISQPAELSSLSLDSRVVVLSFFDSDEGTLVAEGLLSPSEDGLTWTGAIPVLKEGTYLVHLELQQDWETSLSGGSLRASPEPPARLNGPSPIQSLSSFVAVSVAVYETLVSVDGGQNQILFDVSPSDFSLSLDNDGDGLSNLREITGTTHPLLADTDGDGVFDGLDLFPNLSTEFGDRDDDGVGDNADNCVSIVNPGQEDNDKDGHGDACDADDDGDGISDEAEAVHGTSPLLADTDGDGIGDVSDNCGSVSNADQIDTNGDGLGNACDPDDDNDGFLDGVDTCPLLASADQTDSNGDGVGDVCTGDDDGDGVLDAVDNCRSVANVDQVNTDGDALGDACDPDDDNDGVSDVEETSPGEDNFITNRLAVDTDGDGILDNVDKCPITLGDACECVASDEMATREAVFVRTSGDDTHSGARNDAVKTIGKAIQIAQSRGKSKIFVEKGIYAENITMADGISIYGGFNLSADGSTCVKRLAVGGGDDNTTTITSSVGPTVTFSNLTNTTKLEGVSVESTSAESPYTLVSIVSGVAFSNNNITLEDVDLTAPNNPTGSTTALSVVKASPVVFNSIIRGGDSQESTAIALTSSPAAKLAHNTIRGGTAIFTSTALQSFDSVPALVNNIFFTAAGQTQRVLFFADADPSPLIICHNNLLFGADANAKLYGDLNLGLHLYTSIAEVNALGGNYADNVGTSEPLANIFSDNHYRLTAASPALSFGIDPTSIGLAVAKDRDGGARPQGAGRDVGAFER